MPKLLYPTGEPHNLIPNQYEAGWAPEKFWIILRKRILAYCDLDPGTSSL